MLDHELRTMRGFNGHSIRSEPELYAAGNSAVCSRRLSDKAGGTSLRKEGADPYQHHPGENVRKVR